MSRGGFVRGDFVLHSIAVPRCYYMHEFSVNHMRTKNAHNTLSAQSDQPHCCLLLKYHYRL